MAAADGNLGTQLASVAVLLFVGLFVVSQISGVVVFGGTGGSSSSFEEGSVRIGADRAVLVTNYDNVSSVADSTGRGLQVSGDGAADIGGDLGNISHDRTMAFGTYVDVDNTTTNATVLTVGKSYHLSYLASGQYMLHYYNESSRNSYRVTIAAVQSDNLDPVYVERNGTTIRLYNSSGNVSTLTISPNTDSSAPYPNTAGLDGRIDETRGWNATLTTAERQTYYADGIEPVGVGSRAARLLYDQDGSDVAIEFTSSNGSLSGDAQRGTGLAATTMVEGVDYDVTDQGDDLLVDGFGSGDLANQPRLAIDVSGPNGGGSGSIFDGVFQMIGTAFALGGLVMLAVVARRVIDVTNDM